ncbi:shikimate kinase [Ottowia sp.]|uniref:shikimate kinase n=1 Tax=Ottowia sp. TaxID=1898956 RepID=UPI002C8B205E|nr:shikimate kinase [Ottowia sp.]HPZ55812.1 shikimate kinase [Ottowia sp.]HQD48004.1 shikimate kinase [Ottowia sp.]
MHIVLVGLPGSGKSTVARSLARRLQLASADSDQVIEQRLACSIRSYFDAHGEAAFRDVEEVVIDELTSNPSRLVLATGGGAVLRPANRRRLHERGTVIYLRASPEQLARRLRHDTKRPLLQVADPLKRLRDLYAERDPLYRECAHFVVDAHGTTLSMLVSRILMQLDMAPPAPPPPPVAPPQG